jgi:hypothetical protein
MKRFPRSSAFVLCAFFILSFALAVNRNPYFPMLVLAGEDSVGTWMSGVLLIICAVMSLMQLKHAGWYPWLFISAFFFLLAADERFMFHERMKDSIIFSNPHAPLLLYELPVISAACVGGVVGWLLWKHLTRARLFLIVAIVLGSASVVFDVLSLGLFWEECFKLTAELLLACMMMQNQEG